MAGYIGSKASVISSKAGFKNTFAISTTTTLLEGVTYTVNRVNVFHNGVRLVDGTDYTATNGTSITLTSAAENGDQIVITSQADFNVANTYTQAQADATFLKPASTLDATKLSGALPAISGANLTGIAASLSALTDCTVSTANPAPASNPTSGLGHTWINKTSGQVYILTDATAGQNIWKNVGDGSGEVGYFTATGGTVTTSGSYTIHTFTSSGTFQVTAGSRSLESLVIAGGGAGGYDDGGGGGAGGYRSSTSGEASGGGGSAENKQTLGVGSYTITIGAGGSGASPTSTSGGNSVFNTGVGLIEAVGGGYGGGNISGGPDADSGGSGGGCSLTSNAGAGTSNQGFAGAKGVATDNQRGGGGGASELGSTDAANFGGDGVTSSINGTATLRGGGGGGSTRGSQLGTGGTGGGGTGADYNNVRSVTSGTVNTGGGGGGGQGGGGSRLGGHGGSGIIIIRYLTA